MAPARRSSSGLSSRVDPGGCFGCAGILLLFGGLVVFLGYHNHDYWLARQQQIPRFQKVRATVTDKGIAHYESHDRKTGRSTSRDAKWIHFTCRIGDRGDKDGARLTLSGSDEGWEDFEKGRDYDAFYDPIVNECVLILDERVGDPDYGLRGFLHIAAALGAVAAALVALGVFLRLRR